MKSKIPSDPVLSPDIIRILLTDQYTGKPIVLNTSDYGIDPGSFISEEVASTFIPRSRKPKGTQQSRTRKRAEVYTPIWVCNEMNDLVVDELRAEHEYREFLADTMLEITCGEAPYLVQRYDSETGESIEISKRHGLLDIKLQAIDQWAFENSYDHFNWYADVLEAYKSLYGFELQGDSLFLARKNMLMSFYDYAWYRGTAINSREIEEIATIISYNLIQLDGLKKSWMEKFIDWKKNNNTNHELHETDLKQ